jgi:hypothetical protein
MKNKMNMKIFLAILVIPSLVGGSLVSVKNYNKFDKHINFLIDHVYGEVMISHDGNDLVDSIFERINQLNQIKAILVVDDNMKTKTACQRCDWIVMVYNDKDLVSRDAWGSFGFFLSTTLKEYQKIKNFKIILNFILQ